MTKTNYYLLSGQLYDLINLNDCCINPGKSYFTAIISAVLNASGYDQTLEITNYKEWNLLHYYRSAIQRSAGVNVSIISIEILKAKEKIKIHFEIFKNEVNTTGELILQKKHFKSELWKKSHNPGGKLLDSKESVDVIFCLFEKAKEVMMAEESLQIGDTRFYSTYQMYKCLHGIYSTADEVGKKQIETTLGAALFYLPHPVNESWSRLISVNAILEFKRGYSMVKDHMVPRRMASKKILSLEIPLEYENFKERFQNEFSKYSYVTTKENKKLINYKGEYLNAANELGIKFLKFPLDFNHNRLKNILLNLNSVDQESLNKLLTKS